MSDERRFRLFNLLYLLSFGVLAAWFVLLLVGYVQPDVMALANRIALPTLLGSIACVELFKRLACRVEKRLLARRSQSSA